MVDKPQPSYCSRVGRHDHRHVPTTSCYDDDRLLTGLGFPRRWFRCRRCSDVERWRVYLPDDRGRYGSTVEHT